MDFLDDEEFYDLMQAYRHTPIIRQQEAVQRYEYVKEFIRIKIKEEKDMNGAREFAELFSSGFLSAKQWKLK